MKTRHAIILFILGLCLAFIGGLFKILHLTGADDFLILAVILQIGGGLIFLIKLLSAPKVKKFLDW